MKGLKGNLCFIAMKSQRQRDSSSRSPKASFMQQTQHKGAINPYHLETILQSQKVKLLHYANTAARALLATCFQTGTGGVYWLTPHKPRILYPLLSLSASASCYRCPSMSTGAMPPRHTTGQRTLVSASTVVLVGQCRKIAQLEQLQAKGTVPHEGSSKSGPAPKSRRDVFRAGAGLGQLGLVSEGPQLRCE